MIVISICVWGYENPKHSAWSKKIGKKKRVDCRLEREEGKRKIIIMIRPLFCIYTDAMTTTTTLGVEGVARQKQKHNGPSLWRIEMFF